MHRTVWFLLIGLTFNCTTFADDWPQWRGPDRTAVSKEKGLLQAIPKSGPKLLWSSSEMGIGYGGPAIVGDRLYILGGDEKVEQLHALDVGSGKSLWSVEVGSFYKNAWGGGPRSTPTVDGGMIYVLGAQGNLVCVEASAGKKVWSVSLTKELGGGVPNWGYSESPLIDGEYVVCTPGGSKGTMAALDKKSGKVIWRSTAWKDGAQYASIVISTANNSRQYITNAGKSAAGIDAMTGNMVWNYPRANRVATIPTPIVFDNFVYLTSGYNVGCDLLELTGKTARKVYANSNMTNQHGGVILHEGHIFGYHDGKGWVCQNVKTGEIVWTSRKFPKGSIVYADGHFWCYAETKGSVVLIEATTTGWNEKGRFEIPRKSESGRGYRNPNNIWTHPVVANGKLYLRDQELLFCYDIKDSGR